MKHTNPYAELDIEEKYGLADFWEYLESIEKRMVDIIKWDGNESRELPQYNQRICAAYAAATWNDHVKRVLNVIQEKRVEEMFKKEHPEAFMFLKWFDHSTIPSEVCWGKEKKLIKANDIDRRQAFLAATEEDFKALKGVGKNVLVRILDVQKLYRAHVDFFDKHPSFIKGESA